MRTKQPIEPLYRPIGQKFQWRQSLAQTLFKRIIDIVKYTRLGRHSKPDICRKVAVKYLVKSRYANATKIRIDFQRMQIDTLTIHSRFQRRAHDVDVKRLKLRHVERYIPRYARQIPAHARHQAKRLLAMKYRSKKIFQYRIFHAQTHVDARRPQYALLGQQPRRTMTRLRRHAIDIRLFRRRIHHAIAQRYRTIFAQRRIHRWNIHRVALPIEPIDKRIFQRNDKMASCTILR